MASDTVKKVAMALHGDRGRGRVESVKRYVWNNLSLCGMRLYQMGFNFVYPIGVNKIFKRNKCNFTYV